jgi:hypothetical protein
MGDRSGGPDVAGGLDRPYASALERPAPRKTAPPEHRARRAREVSPARRDGRDKGRAGAPRPPACRASQAPSMHRRAALSYGGGIATTPAAAHSHAAPPRPTRDTRTARVPSTPDPAPLPTTTATPTSPPPRPRNSPSCRLDGSPPSPLGHSPPCRSSPLPRLRLPPPRLRPPPASRLGWPVQVYLAGRGRGVRRKAADPPSSKAQAGRQGNTLRRGGCLLRSWKKPIERNRWSETNGGKQAWQSPEARSGDIWAAASHERSVLLPVSRGRGVKAVGRRQGERCFRREAELVVRAPVARPRRHCRWCGPRCLLVRRSESGGQAWELDFETSVGPRR